MIENLNTLNDDAIFYTYLIIGIIVLYITITVTFTFIINLRKTLKYSPYNIKRLWIPALGWPVLLIIWFIQWLTEKIKAYRKEE